MQLKSFLTSSSTADSQNHFSIVRSHVKLAPADSLSSCLVEDLLSFPPPIPLSYTLHINERYLLWTFSTSLFFRVWFVYFCTLQNKKMEEIAAWQHDVMKRLLLLNQNKVSTLYSCLFSPSHLSRLHFSNSEHSSQKACWASILREHQDRVPQRKGPWRFKSRE